MDTAEKNRAVSSDRNLEPCGFFISADSAERRFSYVMLRMYNVRPDIFNLFRYEKTGKEGLV